VEANFTGDVQLLVGSAAAYRKWTRRFIVVGLVLCTAVLVSYASDLGEHTLKREFRIVVLAVIGDLMLAFGLWRSLRTPGIVTALQSPENLVSYRLVRVDGTNIGIIWLYTKKGAYYEIPITSGEPNAGERAFKALMAHAPHLVEHEQQG